MAPFCILFLAGLEWALFWAFSMRPTRVKETREKGPHQQRQEGRAYLRDRGREPRNREQVGGRKQRGL